MGSAGSYPAMTSRMSAASVTVRAIGPTSSCVWLFGMTPPRLTSPRVGRTPTRLLAEDGRADRLAGIAARAGEREIGGDRRAGAAATSRPACA